MMKIKFIAAVILFPAVQVFSQINKVEVIGNYRSQIDSMIMLDAEIHTALMVHSISFETNKRAIGKQFTNIRFYYPMPLDSAAETDKGTEFLYIYKPPVKVEVKYSIAASQDNSIDYYFDEDGILVFYHSISTGAYGCSGEKYYFGDNKLLKYMIYTIGNCFEAANQIVEGNEKDKDFTRHDLFLAEKIVKKSKEYLKMFNELVKLESVDKE